MMKYILAFMVALTLHASSISDVTQMIDTKVTAITALLQNGKLERSDQDKQIIDTVEPILDFELMARLSLGKEEWVKLDASKREDFTSVFASRVKQSYLEKLHLYTDEKVVVKEGIQTKKTRIEVPSFIIGKQGDTQLLYKLYSAKKGWLVYDIEIAGVSIVQTYRAQFAELLQNNNVDQLIEKLRSAEAL